MVERNHFNYIFDAFEKKLVHITHHYVIKSMYMPEEAL